MATGRDGQRRAKAHNCNARARSSLRSSRDPKHLPGMTVRWNSGLGGRGSERRPMDDHPPSKPQRDDSWLLTADIAAPELAIPLRPQVAQVRMPSVEPLVSHPILDGEDWSWLADDWRS